MYFSSQNPKSGQYSTLVPRIYLWYSLKCHDSPLFQFNISKILIWLHLLPVSNFFWQWQTMVPKSYALILFYRRKDIHFRWLITQVETISVWWLTQKSVEFSLVKVWTFLMWGFYARTLHLQNIFHAIFKGKVKGAHYFVFFSTKCKVLLSATEIFNVAINPMMIVSW